MSPSMRTILAVTDRLVAIAENHGIEIDHVSLTLPGIAIYPLFRDLAPTLAAALGLTEQHIMDNKDGSAVEFFDGDVDGIKVTTHHRLTTVAVAS